MGYCMHSEEGSIKIKKENMEIILNKLSDLFKTTNGLRWVNGFQIEDMNNDEEDEYSLTLRDIWDDLRYNYVETDTHYIIDEFLGEKFGDDDVLFKLIAPYCEDGYLQFCGEDSEHFRFVIKDGKFKEVYADLKWD